MQLARLLVTVIAGTWTVTLAAQDPFATQVRSTEPLTPTEQLAKFHLPPGFEIQLVAAEPEIQKPMNMAFDAQGRLWVSGSIEYPYAAQPDEGRDTIRVLHDTTGDGRADRVTTFADGLNIPMGLYPYRDGVVAYSMPNIWFLRDTDGDGVCDQREVLYGPLGEPVDTHGMQNAFRRGNDGWLYICHGFRNESTIRGRDGSEIKLQSGNTYRVRLDGSRVEQFTWGQVNPFGSTFLPNGDLITADCHSKPLTLLLRGGYFSSFGKPDDGLGFVPSIMEHGHGSTAIAGAAFYDGDGFPEPYRGSLFVGNVMTSRVHRDALVWHGSTLEAHEEEDFLTCDDPWFRPVDLRIGPDGALYIADFYNRIIGHYEVPLDHPGRDRVRGRIWRVVYRGTGSRSVEPSHDLSRAGTPELIAALGSSAQVVRELATDQLSDRIGLAGVEPLLAAASSSSTTIRIHALWTLHRLGVLPESTLATAARDNDEPLRVHAMRILSESSSWSDTFRAIAVGGLTDEAALVQRAAADALGQHPDPSVIAPLVTALSLTAADDVHLQHTLRIALRNQLRQSGAIAHVRELSLEPDQFRALAPIAVAVPSSEAADWLIAMIKSEVADPTQLRQQLKHAATHVSVDALDDLVELVRQRAGDDVDFQLALIQLLQQQLLQRGMRHTERVAAWGGELADRLLDAGDAAARHWTSVSGSNPWGLERRQCADGEQNVLFLSSLPGGERATGVLRSTSFPLPEKLSFFLCGHLGFPTANADQRNLVRLRIEGSDEIIQQVYPPRHDVARRVEWDLREWSGQRGYLEIVDGLDLQAYAWLAVSRFEPTVVTLPSVAPQDVAHRQTSAAVLAKTLRLRHLAPLLTQLAAAETTDMQARAACVDALLTLAPHPFGAALLRPLRDETVALELRAEIANTLSSPERTGIDDLVRQVMRAVPTRVQDQMAEELASSADGGDMLLRLIAEGLASPRLLQRPAIHRALLATGLLDVDKRVAELSAGLPTVDAQLATLIEQRVRGFSPAAASVARGREAFVKHCAACHQVAGQGALVGPQLDGIGNRGLERVAEDLLDPNRNIDAAFHVTVLATIDGRVLSGLFRRQEGPSRIFAGKDGKEFSVLVDEIEEEQKSRTSIMPDNFGTILSDAECHDLLAYLMELRAKPVDSTSSKTNLIRLGQESEAIAK